MATLLLILKILLYIALVVVIVPWIFIVLADTVKVGLYTLLYARKILVEIRQCYSRRDEIKTFASKKEKVRCRDDTGSDEPKNTLNHTKE